MRRRLYQKLGAETGGALIIHTVPSGGQGVARDTVPAQATDRIAEAVSTVFPTTDSATEGYSLAAPTLGEGHAPAIWPRGPPALQQSELLNPLCLLHHPCISRLSLTPNSLICLSKIHSCCW